jgi:hypothetical protein
MVHCHDRNLVFVDSISNVIRKSSNHYESELVVLRTEEIRRPSDLVHHFLDASEELIAQPGALPVVPGNRVFKVSVG